MDKDFILQDLKEKEFKVYTKRYLIAFLYFIACLSIQLSMHTFVPQSSYLTQIYDIPSIMVAMTSLIHLIVYIPISFPANYIVDKYGIRVAMIIVSIFCITGCWVRCLINTGGFWFAILGQLLVGIVNPMITNSLNKVSTNWFYPEDRVGVTVFLSFFGTVSSLLGILMPGIWFKGYTTDNLTGQDLQDKLQEGKDLQFNLILVQAIIVTLMMVSNIFWFQNKPPTPPSFTSQVEKEDFKVALKFLSTNKNYLLQCLSFSFCYFVWITLAINLSFLLKPFGLGDPLQSSILSIMTMPGGVIGCVLISLYLKRIQKYKFIILTCQVGGGISLGLIGLSLWTHYYYYYYLVLVSIFFFGFFMLPMIPTMLEFACENCFPIGEGSITGFIWALANTFGAFGGAGITQLLGTIPPDPSDDIIKQSQKKSMWALAIFLTGFMFSLGFTFLTQEILNRKNVEQSRKVIKIYEDKIDSPDRATSSVSQIFK